MTVYNLYSKRQKKLRGEIPDVYTYNDLPEALRVQIIHIWQDVLGNDGQFRGNKNVQDAYSFIVNTLRHEYGVFELISGFRQSLFEELVSFTLKESEIDKVFDAIEMSFMLINVFASKPNYLRRQDAAEKSDNAIKELNIRFKEHGVGYQFVENKIIRTDSELLHVEVVKPALNLLNQKHYQGSQQEFLSAYEHYRHGKNKESLNDCLKSFESTMKAICDKGNWTYKANATAKALIQICFDNELVPSFWQTNLSSLRSLLESSIPTGRNKLGGHGQGTKPIEVPDNLVAYMLHMTASTLVFLTSAEKHLK